MKINKETILKLNPLFQAIAEGKAIQVESGDDWIDIDFNGEGVNVSTLITCPECYRIKPEPKYRPFKNAEECWQVMQKHQPFGWMNFKDTKCGYYMLTNVSAGVGVGINDSLFSYDRIFNDYTFADGTPFGVKVEE